MKANLEEKKIQESISKKKKYLSRKTKEIVKTIPEFMLSFNDSKRVQWDICVILMTIFNCFYIPFNIAFEPSLYYELEVLNSIIDFVFYLDIILNLRTTFMTKSGEEIMNSKEIAKRYILQGTFLVDVLSILPLNAVISVSLMNNLIILNREIKSIWMPLVCLNW